MSPLLRFVPLVVLCLCVGCSGGDGDDDGDGSAGDAGSEASDMTTGIDFFTNPDSGQPPQTWTYLRIEDETRPGEGLPLDAVEVCLIDGSGCVPMTAVATSSDPDLDYSGVQDGPSAQDDTCTEASFTELGAGNSVILGFDDPEQTIDETSKINVWIGASACSLIPPGDKPFTISVGDDPDAPGAFLEVEQCLGTCTVSAETP